MADNAVWQRHWRRIGNLPKGWYDAPTSRIARRFVKRLTAELKGVKNIEWNYKHPLVFVAVILHMYSTVRSPKDICTRINWKLDLWYQGH